MDLTEEQIKQGLRDKLKNLERQIDLVKTALKAFGDNPKLQNLQINAFDEANAQDNFTVHKDRSTVRARVEGLLADAQTPMTSKEIMQTLNRVYNKKYTSGNFSGNFSQAYRKSGSKVKQFAIPDAPIEHKFVYGLISWANGDELKQEYLQRFLDKH